MAMKILITGATGLVGRELISRCLEQGISVNFLTTREEKINSVSGAQGYLWKPEIEQIDNSCFDDVNAIVNLAGSPIAVRWTSANRKKILQSRIQSLKTLYKGLQQSVPGSVECLVTASAIGIYPHSFTTYYSENETEVSQDFAGQVVKAWEEEAKKLQEVVPKVAMVRIGLVLSGQGGALPKMAAPVRSFVGAAFGSGEQWQSWIHIGDLAKMILFLIEKELDGIFNGVAPNPVTQNKLIKELAHIFKRPVFFPNIPNFALKLLLGKMSEILTSSQRVSCKKIESLGFQFDYLNVCRALESIYAVEQE